MTIWDDRILEILTQWDSGTPKKLSETQYIHVSRSQVNDRLKKLQEHGLVNHLGNGVYVITDRGVAYLDGELSTAEDVAEDPIEAEAETSTADQNEQA